MARDVFGPNSDTLGNSPAAVVSNKILDSRRYTRIRVRNDLPNPRLLTGANVTPNYPAGFTNTGVTYQADSRFESHSGAGNGRSATISGDAPGGIFNFLQLSVTGAVVEDRSTQQLIFGRARAIIEAAPPGSSVRLWLSTTGGTGKGRVVKTIDNVVVGKVYELEGALLSNIHNLGAGIVVEVMGTNGGHVSLTIGRCQITTDPQTECPAYVDGTVLRGAWDGTADASTSQGWAIRSAKKAPLKYIGYSANSTYGIGAPLDGERVALLMLESNTNLLRIGVDVSGVWDTPTTGPNWRAPGIAWFTDLMDALREHGLSACPLIGSPPSWMTTDGAPTTNWPLRTLNTNNYAQFGQLYTSLIDEWPDVIKAVEFFNEPNLTGVWGAAPNPALYTQHMIAMAKAVKAAHPDVTFIGPALSKYAATDASGMAFDTFLQGVYNAGGGPYMDAISVHPYGDQPGTQSADAAAPTGWNTGHDQVMAGVRRVKRANGDAAKPIWITEVGGDVANAGWNERTLAQSHMLMRGMYSRNPEADVEALCIHTLVDRPSVPADMGVLNKTTLAKKIAFQAYAKGVTPMGEWVPIPMLNGWVPYLSGHPGLQYRLNENGTITVRGEIKGGSSPTAAIGFLPANPEPGGRQWYVGAGWSGTAYVVALIQVNSDNQMFAAAGGSATLTTFEFDYTPAL